MDGSFVVHYLGEFQGIKWGRICLARFVRPKAIADGKIESGIVVRAHPKGARLLPIGSSEQIIVERGDGNNIVLFCTGMWDSYYTQGSVRTVRRVGYALGGGQVLYGAHHKPDSTGSCRLYRPDEALMFYSSRVVAGTNTIEELVFTGKAGSPKLRRTRRKIVPRS